MESEIAPGEFEPNVKKIGENAWSVSLEEDPETGDLIMPIPQELLTSQGWSIGDTLTWDLREDGSAILVKKD